MSFRVVVARSAARRLAEQLPESVATACVEFMFGALAVDPRKVGAPLRKPFDGQWRARRGDYRVRYLIDEENQTVTCSISTIAGTPTAADGPSGDATRIGGA